MWQFLSKLFIQHSAVYVICKQPYCLCSTANNHSTTGFFASLGRSLDVPAAREIERLQAMRFVRQVRRGREGGMGRKEEERGRGRGEGVEGGRKREQGRRKRVGAVHSKNTHFNFILCAL